MANINLNLSGGFFMIIMKNICKTYRTARRNAGFKEAARSFFHREYETVNALDNISFTISI